MAKIDIGDLVWIPCEVKPGPFSNERVVLVEGIEGPWVGFVNVRFLKEPIEEGQTHIRARVVSLAGENFQAALPGHSVASRTIETQRDKATRAIQA